MFSKSFGPDMIALSETNIVALTNEISITMPNIVALTNETSIQNPNVIVIKKETNNTLQKLRNVNQRFIGPYV